MSVPPSPYLVKKPVTASARVIGADHHAFLHARNAVLRFHAFAGFFVTLDEIAEFDPDFTQRRFTG